MSLIFFSARPLAAAEVGQPEKRTGDEIVVCGQFFHTTAPVVLWMDPGGYDAYRTERRFAPLKDAPWNVSSKEVPALKEPTRYSDREVGATPESFLKAFPSGVAAHGEDSDEIMKQRELKDEAQEKVRDKGWDLETLQKVVDQFVIHFDVAGTSRTCFRVLQDERGLSVHFMLDVDGTIYQTLDLKERAWQATIANNRSVGVEIAQMGAYPPAKSEVLDKWYVKESSGDVLLHPPKPWNELGVRTPAFVGRPDRPEPIVGTIQGDELKQYDFTPEQYDSLIKLTATLCRVLPRIECKYPVDSDGKLIPHKLTPEEWRDYHGVLGHYHVQQNKNDPGPAFNWDKVIGGAKKLLDEAK